MPTRFDRHTRVLPSGPGRFRVQIDPSWWIVRGPNGGYIAALLVRALEAAVADPTRQLRSLTVHYLRPPAAGPAEIEVSVDRQGRTLTNLRAALVQDGKLQATAIAAFAGVRDTPALHHAVMPEVAPWEALQPRQATIPIHGHYELRFALGPASQDAPRTCEAVTGGWIRLREPRPLDAALLTAYADGWPPAVFATGELPPSTGGVPTIDLTVHIRARLPASVGPASSSSGRGSSRTATSKRMASCGAATASCWPRRGSSPFTCRPPAPPFPSQPSCGTHERDAPVPSARRHVHLPRLVYLRGEGALRQDLIPRQRRETRSPERKHLSGLFSFPGPPSPRAGNPDRNRRTNMLDEAPLEDRHLLGIEALSSPEELKAATPPTEDAGRVVRQARAALRRCLHGEDRRRLVVIAGPCSLHDAEAALAYADRLAPLAARHAGELLVLMRAYFEKPRTTVGWKGLVNDPHLDGSCALDAGLREARRLLLAITERGVACATEFLDPVTPAYLADLVAWAAIGARTTESQTHRDMASGLSMPVGFKNGTDGGVQVALDAMVAASHPQTFLGVQRDGRAAAVRTAGNPDTHVVLRGGRSGPNCGAEDVARAAEQAARRGAARGVLIDCSHANSAKDFRRQRDVARGVAAQVRAGAPGILGAMVESHLHEGRQDWVPGGELRFGVSITDACLGFEDTEDLLTELAGAVRSARPGASRVRPAPTPGDVATA